MTCLLHGSLLLPNTVGRIERVIAVVSCGQFRAVHLKFKLSAYIQETAGDRRGCIQRTLNGKNG